jgi:secondary thiamine-phosphate synthase enzyme
MIAITTDAARIALDITDLVLAELDGFTDGLALVSCPHTSAAVFLCEADDELLADFASFSERWLAGLEPFTHIRKNNPNAAAHITSVVMGAQFLLPIRAGEPQLGTYQRVVFLELDGPKSRQVFVHRIPTTIEVTA